MFQYHVNASELYIELPDVLEYNFDFLVSMANMTQKVKSGNYTDVYVTCNQTSDYSKMAKGTLFSTLEFLAKGNRIKVWSHKNFDAVISKHVHRHSGENFLPIQDMSQILVSSDSNYYVFRDAKGVTTAINEITKLLIEYNVSLHTQELKEFLSTVIGEIFSNSMNHSNQNEAILLFDVICEQNEFYLNVSISDYGTTILHNVRRFFQCEGQAVPGSVECMAWSVRQGTTTRKGSGGYGLPTMIAYIQQVRGSLYIFSGDAVYKLCQGENSPQEMDGYCYGTHVVFQVKLFDNSIAIGYDRKKEELVRINLNDI